MKALKPSHPRAGDLNGIGRRIVWGLGLLNLLVLLAAAGLSWRAWHADLEAARTQSLNVARLAEQATDTLLDKASLALEAAVRQLERQLIAGGIDRQTLWAVVDRQARRVPELQALGVFDARGRQVCGEQPASRCRQLDVADRDYFLRLRDHPDDPVRLYGPHVSRLDGQVSLVLAEALRDPGGGFAGLVIALLPAAGLQDLIAAADLGPNGIISVRRIPDHALVVRVPPFSADQAASAPLSETLQDVLQGAKPDGVYRSVSATDGRERVVAVRTIGDQPLVVLVGLALDDVMAPWRRLSTVLGLFVVIFAAASVVIARVTRLAVDRQARAQRLYDEAPCGYHSLDAQGRYIEINATELGWLGCTREELLGRLRPTDFTNDEGRATFALNFPRLPGQPIDDLEFDLCGRDGTVRRMLVSARPVCDAQGRLLRTHSVVVDISALHDARRRLQALVREQGLMLETELVGIARVHEGRFVWTNRGMTKLFGHPSQAWSKLSMPDLLDGDSARERFAREAESAAVRGLPFGDQLPMRHQDGSRLSIGLTGQALEGPQDELLLVMADIGPIQLAAELQAQNQALRETSRQKSEFLANMSHELRTPLNGVIVLADLLKLPGQQGDADKVGRYANSIAASGRRLLALVESVLAMAQLESQRIELDIQAIDVEAAAAEVLALVAPDLAVRRISVVSDLPASLPRVLADRKRLRQVLQALLDNAIKFSGEGRTVTLRAAATAAGRVAIDVVDQGIGIAETDLQHLFVPFRQLSQGNTKTHGGAGLGLALARRLVEAQGGSLTAHSRQGEGSTFRIELPAAP